MEQPVIEVKNLVRQFGKIQALDDLSFEVKKGEVFGFVGPNGAGKTTTIRVLLGLCQPEQGESKVLGWDTKHEFSQIGPHLGIVLEHSGLYDDLTGLENLDSHGELLGLTKAQRTARIGPLLETVGLQDRAGDKVKTYSKGMKQRLSVALALINDPELLLLDEPFDGIDTETHHHLRNLIHDLAAEQGKTIFLTSHDLNDVEKLATRVAILQKGRVLVCDTVDNLRQQTKRNRAKIVFARSIETDAARMALQPLGLASAFTLDGNQLTLSFNGSVVLEDVVKQLVLSDLPIREVTAMRSSLEEAYFAVLAPTAQNPS